MGLDHDGDDTWPTEAADTLIGLAAMAVAGLALIGLVAIWRRR